MINPNKLFQLSGGQQRRKLALCFGALERDILGIAEKGSEYNFSTMTRADYIKALCRVFLQDPKISQEAAKKISAALESQPFDERLACNLARNELLAIIGEIVILEDTDREVRPGSIVLDMDLDSSERLGDRRFYGHNGRRQRSKPYRYCLREFLVDIE